MGKFVGFVLVGAVWQHAWSACNNSVCSSVVTNGLLQTKRGRLDAAAILETGVGLPPLGQRTPDHIPVNTARNGAAWKVSQVASPDEINKTHDRALLSIRRSRTMDETLQAKGSPRRRERHTHPDQSYRINKDYQDHYDRCRSELFPENNYAVTTEFVYAKLVLWEDYDCRGARHEYHISHNTYAAKNPSISGDSHRRRTNNFIPDIIKAQHQSDGGDKISSFGFSMNHELLFDGKHEGGDDDGKPVVEMSNPNDNQLFVQGAGHAEAHLTGHYDKQSGRRHGQPYWRKEKLDVYLYSCPSGTWMVGPLATTHECRGWFHLGTQHHGTGPAETGGTWRAWAGAWVEYPFAGISRVGSQSRAANNCRRSVTDRDKNRCKPFYEHGDQEFCVELYEHSSLNGYNDDCNFAEERADGTTCNKYSSPGQIHKECCNVPSNFAHYSGFCAFNVPHNFNDRLSSWTFYRNHRRRNGVGCATEIVPPQDKGLDQCLKDQMEQSAWDAIGFSPSPVSPGDIRASMIAAESCSTSCAQGGTLTAKCAEAMTVLAGGKTLTEAFGYGMSKRMGGKMRAPLSFKASLGVHAAQVAVSAGYGVTNCFLYEIRSGAASCLSPSTKFRGQSGALPLASLNADSELVVINAGDISQNGVVDNPRVSSGRVLGFATKNDNSTREYIEFKTASGKTVRCTPNHYLWASNNGSEQFFLAQDVRKGFGLPTVGEGATSVQWDVVDDISDGLIEHGAVMPIARTSDWNTADMVVTDSGIVVPVYAGGMEYRSLTPADAHKLFKAWLFHWSKLQDQLPCLMNISHGTHGSMLLEILKKYGEHHHIGRLGKVEMDPEEFLCYVGLHVDQFSEIIKSDEVAPYLEKCPGMQERVQKCGAMRDKIFKDVLNDDGDKLLPDQFSPPLGNGVGPPGVADQMGAAELPTVGA